MQKQWTLLDVMAIEGLELGLVFACGMSIETPTICFILFLNIILQVLSKCNFLNAKTDEAS